MMNTYFRTVQDLLATVERAEGPAMAAAADRLAASIAAGGVVHLFGCGHSHMLTEEVFYRAGGLACVRPIFVTELMLHEGALRSSALERMPGFAATFMAGQDIRPDEVLVVISTSGRNPVPIDVALAGKEMGATVVAVTSRAYSGSQPSRHPSGRRLAEVADLVIDNHAPPGDAALSHPQLPTAFAPTSTVVGAAILNAVMARAVERLVAQGVEPPVFKSGNLDGADEHNRRLVERYRDRIPWLR